MNRFGFWICVVALSPVAQAQETPEASFGRVEEALKALQAGETTEARQDARVDLLEACDGFLARHLEGGPPHLIELAGGYWLDLALRMDVEPERILARIRELRAALDPVPPRLERACQVVEANLRVRPGQPAPPWTAADIHTGSEIQLSDLTGKLVLLDFWATWCAPCLQLMRTRLRRLHARYGDDERFVLVGIGSNRMRDTAELQATLSDEQGFDWLKVFDARGSIGRDYGARALPFMVLIDAEGKILAYGPGYETIDQVEALLAERLGPLIPEEPEDEEE